MNDRETQSGQPVAAAERGPETVLPGPRSLSVLDAVIQMLIKAQGEARALELKLRVQGYGVSEMYWRGYANALAGAVDALKSVESEASKENSNS